MHPFNTKSMCAYLYYNTVEARNQTGIGCIIQFVFEEELDQISIVFRQGEDKLFRFEFPMAAVVCGGQERSFPLIGGVLAATLEEWAQKRMAAVKEQFGKKLAGRAFKTYKVPHQKEDGTMTELPKIEEVLKEAASTQAA